MRRISRSGLRAAALLLATSAIAQAALSWRNVRRYAELVAERYAERELIRASSEMQALAWQTGLGLGDRLDRINALLARAEGLRKGVGTRVPLLRRRCRRR